MGAIAIITILVAMPAALAAFISLIDRLRNRQSKDG